MEKIKEGQHEGVKFIEFDSIHGKIYMNISEELDIVMINKQFKSSKIDHHLQLTVEEFNELKKIEV